VETSSPITTGSCPTMSPHEEVKLQGTTQDRPGRISRES